MAATIKKSKYNVGRLVYLHNPKRWDCVDRNIIINGTYVGKIKEKNYNDLSKSWYYNVEFANDNGTKMITCIKEDVLEAHQK